MVNINLHLLHNACSIFTFNQKHLYFWSCFITWWQQLTLTHRATEHTFSCPTSEALQQEKTFSEHICFNDTCKDGWDNETILLKLTDHQFELC